MTTQFIFDEIAKGMVADPSLVSKVGGVFHFKIDGKSWTVDLKNGSGFVKQGAPEKADVTITIAEADFVNLMTGQANGQSLFMQGKLKMQGNMGLAMKLDKLPKSRPAGAAAPAASSSSSPSASAGSSAGGFRAAVVFEELSKRIASSPELVQQIGGIYQWEITKPGASTQFWTADLKNGKGNVAQGKADKPDCTLTVSDDDFVGMMTGKLNSQQLFMQGKLKIKGNMGLAMKLGKLQQAKASL